MQKAYYILVEGRCAVGHIQPVRGIDEPHTCNLHGYFGKCLHGHIIIFQGEKECPDCAVGSVQGMDVESQV